jgi:hypothetical protein
MEAVSHSAKFAKKVGVSQSVGKEFVQADKRQKQNPIRSKHARKKG